MTVQVSEKIHSPIPENVTLPKTEAENDEAADVEDNVSVCKLVSGGPADEVASENEDFVSVDLTDELQAGAERGANKSWASIAAIPARPLTPLPTGKNKTWNRYLICVM